MRAGISITVRAAFASCQFSGGRVGWGGRVGCGVREGTTASPGCGVQRGCAVVVGSAVALGWPGNGCWPTSVGPPIGVTVIGAGCGKVWDGQQPATTAVAC